MIHIISAKYNLTSAQILLVVAYLEKTMGGMRGQP